MRRLIREIKHDSGQQMFINPIMNEVPGYRAVIEATGASPPPKKLFNAVALFIASIALIIAVSDFLLSVSSAFTALLALTVFAIIWFAVSRKVDIATFIVMLFSMFVVML